jgi:rhamnosyltransferase subunit B
MRAGRPQVVTPFLGDQFDNAERLARLGVAEIVDGKTATADGLCRALSRLDDGHATRAEELADGVRKEDGAAAAAARIAGLVRSERLTQPLASC